jgi:hypothetical protein
LAKNDMLQPHDVSLAAALERGNAAVPKRKIGL